MTRDKDKEAALRRALQPKETPPQPRLMTTPVIFHEDDWRAFFVGMKETIGLVPKLRSAHQISGEPTDRAIVEMYKFISEFTHENMGLFFYDPEKYDYESAKYPLNREDRLRAPYIYFRLGRYGRRFNGRMGLGVTRISGMYYQTDDKKRDFLKSVRRVARRLAPRRMRQENLQTGEIIPGARAISYPHGHAAIRWLLEEDGRFLEEGGRPEPDWTFPEGHPWYQDVP